MGHFDIMMLPCPYRDSHYEDKTVSWPFYFYNRNPYLGKGVFILKWDPEIIGTESPIPCYKSYKEPIGKYFFNYFSKAVPCLFNIFPWETHLTLSLLDTLITILFSIIPADVLVTLSPGHQQVWYWIFMNSFPKWYKNLCNSLNLYKNIMIYFEEKRVKFALKFYQLCRLNLEIF